jgi:hypothetical protein
MSKKPIKKQNDAIRNRLRKDKNAWLNKEEKNFLSPLWALDHSLPIILFLITFLNELLLPIVGQAQKALSTAGLSRPCFFIAVCRSGFLFSSE